jgi:hypothetical protein
MEGSGQLYANLSTGKDPSIHRIGIWVDRTTSLDVLKKKISWSIPGVTNNNRQKGNLNLRDHLGDLDVDGCSKMGLQQYMRAWIGLSCDV